MEEKMNMKLEKFIKNNREVFDTLEPSADLWSRIEGQLESSSKKKGSFRWGGLRIFSMAASVVILIGIGYLIGQYWRPVTENPDIARLSPDYAKQVTTYTSFITEKRAELQQMTADNPALFRQFKVELEALESDYSKLKADLPKNPNQEELLKAMIQNLEWQMQILNQQLSIIEKIKKTQTKSKNEMV